MQLKFNANPFLIAGGVQCGNKESVTNKASDKITLCLHGNLAEEQAPQL